MLDLRIASKKLDSFHQRFLDDNFPSTLSRKAFESFDKTKYSEEDLQTGIRAWQLRTLDEYRSQVAFTELLAEITELGMSFDVLGTCVRVIRDEARHVELCRRMVVTLGGTNLIAGEPSWVHSNKELPLRTRILRTAVGSLCMGETVSVRLLTAVMENTVDPLAKEVVKCLAQDESIHSRFGWNLFELIYPHTTQSEKDDILRLLPHFFRLVEKAVLPSNIDEAEREPLSTGPENPFGSLSLKERIEVYEDALQRDVIRRFEELGIPGRKAWEERNQQTGEN